MSLFPPAIFTLDWTMVASYSQSPLMAPWHALGNTLIGTVFFTWVVVGAIHYTGNWYSDYLPISDSSSYDNTGSPYVVRKILNKNFELDLQKYKDYSPIFLSTTFALQYGLSFATIIAVVVHTALFHGKEIWNTARKSRKMPKDIHMRLMEAYREVPQWWFLGMFAIMVGLGLWTCLGYDTKLPWWGYVLAIVIAAAWMIPIGMIYAITVSYNHSRIFGCLLTSSRIFRLA
jgi:OPT family oligopeptide transporter